MRDTSNPDDPFARLERALMEEYLSERGYSFESLAALDADDRDRLMVAAAAYAALRMAETAFNE